MAPFHRQYGSSKSIEGLRDERELSLDSGIEVGEEGALAGDASVELAGGRVVDDADDGLAVYGETEGNAEGGIAMDLCVLKCRSLGAGEMRTKLVVLTK